jgi:putative hemolysin
VALCILASAFSSSTETALTALGEARARQLVDEGGHRTLQLWLDHPSRVLATLLVVNTLANTLSAALMTELIDGLGASNAVALATGIATLLLLAFGEVTPKTLARQYAPSYAPIVMPLVTIAYWLSYPLVSVLGAVPKRIERLFKKGSEATSEHGPALTSDEIEYMIDLGVRQGVLDREKSALLTSVLEFTDIVTREVMVPRLSVVALPIDATKEEVLKTILDSEHSRIPVYEGSVDEIVGVLYVKTLLADLEMGRLNGPFEIRRYVKPPYFVPELMKISRLLREFQQRKLHLAIVVDEFGGTAGVIALEDVVEEIVGEIQDEQDVEEGRVKLLADGTVVADAAIPLRDLEEHLKVDFPDELDADSLGGFVTGLAGKVPPVGSVLVWEKIRFTVRAGDDRRVTRVEMRHLTPASGESGAERPKEPTDGKPVDSSVEQ